MLRRTLTFALLFSGLVQARAIALDPATAVLRYARASWAEQEGLPSALIWAITQDSHGYLWLGTAAGLVRFDGIRFVQIDEIAGASVPALLSARDDSLWIALQEGPTLARLKSDHYTRFTDGLPVTINVLVEDHAGTVWAGGRGGLSWFDGRRWQLLPAPVLGGNAVIGLYEDHDHTLWVATPGGLFRRGEKASTFEPVSSQFVVRALTEDAAGNLWGAGLQRAIGTIVDSPMNARLAKWRDINAWRILRDRNGNLWVATLGRGLLKVTNSGMDGVPTVEQYNGGLSNDVVRSLFEDREGNIWVGTQSGLTRLSDNVIQTIGGSEQIGQPVRTVTTDGRGAMWVGTDDGIYEVTGARTTRFGRGEGLPTLVTNAMHFDRNGVLWVATDQGGVARFEGGRFVPVLAPGQSALRRVAAITSDPDGVIWLADLDLGVFRWKAGTLESLQPMPEIGRRFATVALTDHLGRVWIGFADGTLVVHERGTFRSFGPRDGVPGGRVSALFEDSRHALWIGAANGLSRLVNGVFVPVSPGQPLTNVRAILEDLDHHIWIGTSTALMRFDDDFKGVSLFDASDGLHGGLLALTGSSRAAIDSDGSLWFATSSGISVLNPRRLQRNWLPPPVLIERVVIDDRTRLLSPGLSLPALTSRIQIDYTALSFAAPAKVRFRFKLEGFDRDWIDAGSRRQAFYMNLPPGEYRFRVAAANQGVWNEAGASWNFSIRPTFYQTRLFYAGVLAMIGLAITAAWKIRGWQVHQRLSLILAERTRVAREIHDTLLQSLVGVAFQFDAAGMELEDASPSMRQRLARLRQQIETAIGEARESIWDLRSPEAHNSSLPLTLRELGESLCGQDVQFELSVVGRAAALSPHVEKALLRISTEAVSNAVRHAHASHLRLDLQYDSDAITLRVIDDGCGFDSSVAMHGDHHWGLATMRERAEELGARMSVVSHPGLGTTIEVLAPLTLSKVA